MIPLFFLALAASDPPAVEEKADAPREQVQKMLQDCGTHRFEAAVDYLSDGKPRQTKVKLCGTKGQSDADWVRTLKDAAAKLQANPAMAPEMKTQIIAAINGEVEKLNGTTKAANGGGALAGLISMPQPISLPPRAPAPPPSSRVVESPSIERDYASLPPLPAPKPVVASTGIGSSLPSLLAPRLNILCSTTDDPQGVEACRSLRANSMLTIRADEALSGDTSLRFVRRGDERGDVQLAQMRLGQSVRIALPRRVCDGVVRSSVQIEVMRRPAGKNAAPQLVDSLGPYDLRC
jgi:hypothetical protein